MTDGNPQAAPDPLIGTRIGRYEIRSKLAEGGMGAVYIAGHERLPVKKVVKVLLAEYSRNEVIRQRFEREAMAASRLKHRHIITIDDFGVLPDGQLFLMMPFLEGKPLDAHLRQNGMLSQHHTVHIMVQVCSALQHLHDAGIVHRDLKPGNIFISHADDNPYHVTLIDLGIARDRAEESSNTPGPKTQTGMAMGTPGYMAVEQYGNAGNASPTADVYAAAIVTWEMLTGQLPWGVHDPRVLYHKQMTERPEPPVGHEMPMNLVALLRAALSVRPEDRPPSMRSFAVAFASLTPAVPPHVPSGADILVRFAKEFAQNAPPMLETVRNASSGDRSGPLLWPHRGTHVDSRPVQQLVSSAPQHATPAMAATANERPAGAMPVATAPPPTTLSASSGVVVAQQAPPESRWKLAIIGIGGCAIAGVLTFALVHMRSSPATSHANSGPSQPAAPNAAALSDAPVSIETPIAPTAVVAPAIDAGPANVAAAPLTVSPDAGIVAAPKPQRPATKKITTATPLSSKTTQPPHVAQPATSSTPATHQNDRGSDTHRGSGAKFDPNAAAGEE